MSDIQTNVMDGPQDRKIAWRRAGKGHPIVLLHGITEGSIVFEPVIKQLARDYDVVAIDMAGHQGSSAPGIVGMAEMVADAGMLIQTLRLEDPVLLGHSYGAIIAGALSANGVGCATILIDQLFELRGFREMLLNNRELLEGENFHLFFDQFFASFGMDKLNPSDRDLLAQLHAKADQQFVLAQWAGVMAEDIGPVEELTDGVLRSISTPLLSLHSMDEDAGKSYKDWFLQRVPHAKVEFLGDLSHWPHLVETQNFCRRVKEFDPR